MKLLIVEDDAGIIVVYRQKIEQLLRVFPNAVVTVVQTLAAAKAEIMSFPFPDVSVIDLTLLDATWEETLSHVNEFAKRTEVCIVTGQPVEKVRAVLNNPDIEIVPKEPELFAGNAFLEMIARVLNFRSERRAKRDRETIYGMRKMLGHLDDGTTISPIPQ